jgi:hypothetical protein
MGRTRKKPRIIGSAVPIANSSRKDDVSPAKNAWEMVENKKADRPRPEITSPLADARYQRNKEKGCETQQDIQRTMRSGKVFATVLSALVIPQLLPAPVMNPNKIRREKLNMESDVASSGIPLS